MACDTAGKRIVAYFIIGEGLPGQLQPCIGVLLIEEASGYVQTYTVSLFGEGVDMLTDCLQQPFLTVFNPSGLFVGVYSFFADDKKRLNVQHGRYCGGGRYTACGCGTACTQRCRA